MTQHLNYCRQFVQFVSPMMDALRRSDAPAWADIQKTMVLVRQSQKFLLPEGGVLFEDLRLAALDGERLSLPFPVIALENAGQPNTPLSKSIVLAAESDGHIQVEHLACRRANGEWNVFGEFWLKREGAVGGGTYSIQTRPGKYASREDEYRACALPAQILLNFLNVLQCSNVRTEVLPRSRTRGAMTRPGALRFDDYHVLTIEVPSGRCTGEAVGGLHRSPREHLRRGHIRRLQDGRKLWVNATVVNPGIGGKVAKDYRLAAPAAHVG